MICEEESKHGFNFKEVPQQCHTCLSSTCNMKSVGICWECNSVLVKILEFQNKVLRATEILQLGQAYLYSTLSNLTSVIFNDSSTNVINITETDTDTKLETIDYDIKDDTGHISDEFTQTIEIESFKIELNEVVENNKKSLGTYICDICHTHKSKKNQIVQHIATHYNKARREFFKHYKEWHEKYICHHCGVSFKMRYCIKDHIR
ncbi:hypothetical protein MSG28_015883 [Choristoneura fumiferana]|uniref:Uncharacterized protein n=1 Tax=Choristoneura fumiferana TaxID=7141 RepID=A0ACC0K538_CHOFU|nr:hypothetical protein MSG28_015883 [Choristoneura fumiferana]